MSKWQQKFWFFCFLPKHTCRIDANEILTLFFLHSRLKQEKKLFWPCQKWKLFSLLKTFWEQILFFWHIWPNFYILATLLTQFFHPIFALEAYQSNWWTNRFVGAVRNYGRFSQKTVGKILLFFFSFHARVANLLGFLWAAQNRKCLWCINCMLSFQTSVHWQKKVSEENVFLQ